MGFNQGIQWESYYYDDGSIYEGTMSLNLPHGKGVLSIGYVGGAGLLSSAHSNKIQFGDRYEGEFKLGFAHGMGKYINSDGHVYTGEYKYGLKDGCGEVRNLGPYLREVQSGIDPFKAWITNAEKINKKKKKLVFGEMINMTSITTVHLLKSIVCSTKQMKLQTKHVFSGINLMAWLRYSIKT